MLNSVQKAAYELIQALAMNYSDAKDKLYFYLTELTNQIRAEIFSQNIVNR